MWFDRLGSCVAFLHKFVTPKLVGVVLTDTNKTSYYTLVLFCSHVPRIPLRSPLASPILSLTDRTLVLVLLLLNTNRKHCYHTLKVPPEGWLSSQVPDVRSFPQQQHWLVTKNTNKQTYSCINICPQNATIRNKYAAIWYVLK